MRGLTAAVVGMGLAVWLCAGRVAAAESVGLDATNAPLESLLSWAQREGSTPLKRENREAARAELFARGPESMRYLLARMDWKNDTVHQLLYEMVLGRVGADTCTPVLVESLAAESVDTRRGAAYFLGFVPAPADIAPLLPLLEDELTAGAAARTLGKWKRAEAVPAILPLLRHEKEPRRVLAVNALRDIGDARAIPGLVEALNDPVFTVRKAAARALATFGEPAVEALLAAAPVSSGVARREMARTLGSMRARRAVPQLRTWLKDPEDAGLRRDAAVALRTIDPRRAPRWVGAAADQ
jgi:HEAT repeat protein